VLLTAAGAAIEIKGGNITLKGPGKVEFKAGMKEFKGPGSASQSLSLAKPGELKLCELRTAGAAAAGDSIVAAG
jgi:type VI secretion system secreted protein VgrG